MASEDDNEDVERDEEEAREERPERRESADDRGAGTRTLGVERWVQFGFIAAAALVSIPPIHRALRLDAAALLRG